MERPHPCPGDLTRPLRGAGEGEKKRAPGARKQYEVRLQRLVCSEAPQRRVYGREDPTHRFDRPFLRNRLGAKCPLPRARQWTFFSSGQEHTCCWSAGELLQQPGRQPQERSTNSALLPRLRDLCQICRIHKWWLMSLSALVSVRVGQGRRDALFTGGSGGENSSVPRCFSVGACFNHYSQVVVGATVGARRQTLTFCRKEATALWSFTLLATKSAIRNSQSEIQSGVSRSWLL